MPKTDNIASARTNTYKTIKNQRVKPSATIYSIAEVALGLDFFGIPISLGLVPINAEGKIPKNLKFPIFVSRPLFLTQIL